MYLLQIKQLKPNFQYIQIHFITFQTFIIQQTFIIEQLRRLSLYFKLSLLNSSNGRVVRASASGAVDLNLIPNRVKPMTILTKGCNSSTSQLITLVQLDQCSASQIVSHPAPNCIDEGNLTPSVLRTF